MISTGLVGAMVDDGRAFLVGRVSIESASELPLEDEEKSFNFETLRFMKLGAGGAMIDRMLFDMSISVIL